MHEKRGDLNRLARSGVRRYGVQSQIFPILLGAKSIHKFQITSSVDCITGAPILQRIWK